MQRPGPHVQLTPRDESILLMVHLYRGCMVTHIHDRFWPDGAVYSPCYRRIALLTQAGFLTLTRLPSVTGKGSGKTLVQLGTQGRRVVAARLGFSLRELPRRPDPVTPLFASHHDAICTFRVALERAVDELALFELVDWTNETELRKAPIKVQDRAHSEQQLCVITLVADGKFTLSYQGVAQEGLLEMDMGTIALKRLRLKLRGYLLAHRTPPVPVFFVVPSAKRAELIKALVEHEAEELGARPDIVFTTTQSQIAPSTLLTQPIWQQAGVPDPVAIVSAARAPDHPSVHTALQDQRPA